MAAYSADALAETLEAHDGDSRQSSAGGLARGRSMKLWLSAMPESSSSKAVHERKFV